MVKEYEQNNARDIVIKATRVGRGYKNYIDNYHRIENNTISFENDKSNIFNEFTGYSTPEKLINIPFNKAADLYIYSGLVPACEAYREKYLENNTFNQLDFKFMELFETKLNNLI